VNKSATKMGKRGFEEAPDSTDETHFASVGGAESGAPDAMAGSGGAGADALGGGGAGIDADPELAEVVAGWHTLTPAARRVVLGIVDDARARAARG
jgi:hypothetical protein